MWPQWCRQYHGDRLLYGDQVYDAKTGIIYTPLRLLYGKTYLTIPKYRVTTHESPWVFLGQHRLARLTPTYSPGDIEASMKTIDCARNNPLYSAAVCELTPSEHMVYCSSVEAKQCVNRPVNPVEELFTYITELAGHDCLRPTGSLVIGSVHEGSDLDLVVPGIHCLYKIIDNLGRPATPLNHDMLVSWAQREASARSIPLSTVLRLYRPWQRFILRGRQVSLSPVDDERRLSEEKRVFRLVAPLRRVKIRIYIEPFEATLLDYPGTVMARKGGDTIILTVFDGLYVPALLEGGYFEVNGVEGVLCWGEGDCSRTVMIGVREAPTLVTPLGSLT